MLKKKLWMWIFASEDLSGKIDSLDISTREFKK